MDEIDDMSDAVAPKSDQLNADNLLCGKTIAFKITRRDYKKGTEQPLWLYYDGDNGKPYKPSKGMRHVLMGAWGKTSANYVGKSLTLYRDDKVDFGPNKNVGGIRISKVSHIDKPLTVMIPVARGIRKPFTVEPMLVTQEHLINEDMEALKQACRDAAGQGGAALDAWLKAVPKEKKKHLAAFGAEMRKIATDVDELEAKRKAELQTEQANLPE